VRAFTFITASALAVTIGAAALPATSLASSAAVTVLAEHLNQPKKITITPGGDLLVALSGDARHGKICTDGTQKSCVDDSGAIDLITPSGTVTTLLKDLPSVSSGGSAPEATGPVEALDADGVVQVLFQDTAMSTKTGATLLGSAADRLGDLVAYSSSAISGSVEAAFGPFEADHNPDHGVGTDVSYGQEQAIDSDPYSVVAYRGGYAVADAGGNDVLWVSPEDEISMLAVLPTISVRAAAGVYGSKQKHPIEAKAQAVPDALAVGPDGDLYVGELGGTPDDLGTSSVYRISANDSLDRYATGFSAIGDIAFDSQGRLMVLEIDKDGLYNAFSSHPASGAIIRVAADGLKTTVASTGLNFATGLAVASDGTVYVANDGTTSAEQGHGGEIVAVTLK
jgi:hypothetical protein